VYFEIIQTQNRRPNNIAKFQIKIKILAYHGLAFSGFEQPGPGDPLLGLA